MSRRGTLYAVTPDEAQRLLALVGNDATLAQEARDLYSFERQKAHLITAVDTTWEMIHRCLTNGTLNDFGKGPDPLSWCILGGQSLHAGNEAIVCYVTPERVKEIVPEVDDIEAQWFYNRFAKITSDQFGRLPNMEDFHYTWEYFTNVRNLYTKAGEAGRGIIFVAD